MVFRLGRAVGVRGPGVVIVIPFIETMRRVDLRTVTMDVPPQDVITRDNVSVKVSAVLYFRIVDPMNAVIAIENYIYASNMIAQTTLRSVCGQAELDESARRARRRSTSSIQRIVDRADRALGRQGRDGRDQGHRPAAGDAARDRASGRGRARAPREGDRGRGRVPGGAEARRCGAACLATHPMALTLRYLQTLTEIAGPNNSTTIFPCRSTCCVRSSRSTRETSRLERRRSARGRASRPDFTTSCPRS